MYVCSCAFHKLAKNELPQMNKVDLRSFSSPAAVWPLFVGRRSVVALQNLLSFLCGGNNVRGFGPAAMAFADNGVGHFAIFTDNER